ncbi:hypothetical protein AGMMS49982_18990 [Bacteroidia bacterium]|nr:hypothetical protein AGMMS49982_18990 [Bacteroidia bacterium]
MNAVTLDTQTVTLAFRAVKDDTKVPPCHFSVEELKTEIAQSLKDVAHGRVTTQEQLEKEMILW